jgi:vacuolar-type H+-ATPase subunit C/Vma6
MEGKDKTETESNEHQIDITLDEVRYKNLLDLCNKYASQQDTLLTPKEYILMLIDSAISSVQGSKGSS